MKPLDRLWRHVCNASRGKRPVVAPTRSLRSEMLEQRRLLAADVLSQPNMDGAVDKVIELRLDVREHFDNTVDPANPVHPPVDSSLLAPGSRNRTVAVGEIFDLEISYQDLRLLV